MVRRANTVAKSRAGAGLNVILPQQRTPADKWRNGVAETSALDHTVTESRALSIWKKAVSQTKPPAGDDPYAPAERLRRCREIFSRGFAGWYSYQGALSLYCKLLGEQYPRLFQAIKNVHPVSDNHANLLLKAFSDGCAAVMEKKKDLSMSIFIGINTAGQARRAEFDAVVSSTREWVQGATTWGQRHRRWVENWLCGFVKEWFVGAAKRVRPDMTFFEFIDDPTKWATSGSAPTVETSGVKFRNKWAFSAEMINTFGSMHEWYERHGMEKRFSSECSVALKEESTKVRLIIASPISSLLRQSYVLERLGLPRHLRSTLVNPEVVSEMLTTGWRTLIGLDASKFDHNVPFWFLRKFYYLLYSWARRTGDDELARVVHDEFESLKNTVVIVGSGAGQVRIKYRKGILSGWKFTSLLDSIISQCVCDWIFDETHEVFDYCVQGDDILIRGYEELDVDKIVRSAEGFGMIVNRAKSTTGESAEFLKYLISRGGCMGYPARALRSIFWANPWLPELEAKSPNQVVKGWLTLASRLRPWTDKWTSEDRWCPLIARDLARWSGVADGWEEYLRTPSSIGGGCPLEWRSDLSKAVVSGKLVAKSCLPRGFRLVGARGLANAFGAYSSALSTPKLVRLTTVGVVAAGSTLKRVVGSKFIWRQGVNKFKSYLTWLGEPTAERLHGEVMREHDFVWPAYARLWKPLRRIRWLMSIDALSQSTPLTSHVSEYSKRAEVIRDNWNLAIRSYPIPVSRRTAMAQALLLDKKQKCHLSVYHTL